MNLHAKIMNILADPNKAGTDNPRLSYLHGHRDARHAAAEIALKADALLNDISNAIDISQVRRLLIQHGYYE